MAERSFVRLMVWFSSNPACRVRATAISHRAHADHAGDSHCLLATQAILASITTVGTLEYKTAISRVLLQQTISGDDEMTAAVPPKYVNVGMKVGMRGGARN
jgi:hypothetical protein